MIVKICLEEINILPAVWTKLPFPGVSSKPRCSRPCGLLSIGTESAAFIVSWRRGNQWKAIVILVFVSLTSMGRKTQIPPSQYPCIWLEKVVRFFTCSVLRTSGWFGWEISRYHSSTRSFPQKVLRRPQSICRFFPWNFFGMICVTSSCPVSSEHTGYRHGP